MNASTLRPGLLVSLKTSLRGNINYQTVDLEIGAQLAKWETTRTIADVPEYEMAKQARSSASGLIRKVCSCTAFGLLCPEADADDLERAIAEARQVVDRFNATARMTRVNIYVIVGRIAQDDVEAVRAINSEVRELLDEMTRGVERLDAQAIRNAATRTKQLGNMLTPDARARVRDAIDSARAAATKIVKAGEAAAIEVDRSVIRRITEARTAFLDLGEEVEVARPTVEARALDFAPCA